MFSLIGSVFSATVPVLSYSAEPLSGYAMRPESWTEFDLGADASANLAGMWLSVGSAPSALPSTGEPVGKEGIDLGFAFPFAGQDMTVFGLTADGILYLGTENDFAPFYPAVDNWGISVWPSLSESARNCIFAMPKSLVSGYVYTSEVRKTDISKIAYNADAEKGILTVSFEGLSYSEANFGSKVSIDYDLILKKDGSISVYVLDYREESLPWGSYGLAMMLKGNSNNDILSAKNWDGKVGTSVDGEEDVLSVDGSVPGFGNGLRFVPPLPCVKPEGLAAEWEMDALASDSFSGSIFLDGVCDGILVLASQEEFSDRPADGTAYSVEGETNSVGNAAVVYAGAAGAFSVSSLSPATGYHVKVYPYNALCVGGPLYQQDPAIVFQVRTSPIRPSVSIVSQENGRLRLAVSGSVDDGVLVGLSRKDFQTEDACLQLLEKEYGEGDTLYWMPESAGRRGFLIQAAYEGKVEGGEVEISGLEAGKAYYAYVWTKDGPYGYSSEYSSVKFFTQGTAPLTFAFSSDRVENREIMPAGWTEEEGMVSTFRLSSNKNTLAKSLPEPFYSDAEQRISLSTYLSGTYEANAITPLFKVGQASVRFEARVQMAVSGSSSSLTSLSDADTLKFQIRKAGESVWADTAVFTDVDLDYASDGFASLELRLMLDPEDSYQVRFYLCGKNTSNIKEFSLNSFTVEPVLDCLYPEDLRVVDSLLTHRDIALAWTDRNSPAASVQYRYRPYGISRWSEYVSVGKQSELSIGALKAATGYQVSLRAVCANSDTSLVKTIEASTLRSLPYGQDFTDLGELPEEYGRYRSNTEFPGESDMELVKTTSGFTMVSSGDGSEALGSNLLLMMANYWLTFPTLCLEETPAPVSLRFKAKAFHRSSDGYGPLDVSHKAYVLVLASRDGGFSLEDAVDTLYLKDMGVDYVDYEVDLTGKTGQLHLAFMLCNPQTDYANDPNSFFVFDSVRIAYAEDMTPCLGVEDIRQYGLTSEGITLAWTGYSMEYAIIYTNRKSSVTDTVFTPETEYTFTGLDNNTLYIYQIQSFCEEGHKSAGPLSEEGFFTTDKACLVPDGLRFVSADWKSVSVTSSSVSLEKQVHVWTRDTAYSANSGFHLWNAGIDTLTVAGLQWVSADSSMSSAVEYCLAVRALCEGNMYSAWTDTVTFRTQDMVCPQPESLSVEAGIDTAALSWKPGSGNDSFRIFHKETSGSEFLFVETRDRNFVLENLKPNTPYVWAVQGVCSDILLSGEVEGPDFVTLEEHLGNGSVFGAGLKVYSGSSRQITILNPMSVLLDRVEVYDGLGRCLSVVGPVSDSRLVLSVPGPRGLFVVRIYREKGSVSYKIML